MIRKGQNMIYYGKQEFDQVMLNRTDASEFMKYVSYGVERELINKLLDSVQDHKFHIIKLDEPKTENDPKRMMVSYKQGISDNILVPCEHCKHNPKTSRIEIYGWCRYFIDRMGREAFCPFGEEIQIGQFLIGRKP